MRILATLLLLAACSAGAGNQGNQVANGGAPAVPGSPPSAPPADRCAAGGDEEHCVSWGASEHMQGVWVTGFEVSNFIPDATQAPGRDDTNWQGTWLTFASGSTPDPSIWTERDRMGGAAVAIDFVGRRSRSGGIYGHLGGANQIVIVDRIISMRVLGPRFRD
jgi:hypothetical protein